uniref:G domain-containing protein n=1 Tax=Amphimedon queenslandica TaxID=400682 RepID=A0A1X7UZP2_AMPQE
MAGEAFLREIEERHNNLTDEQKKTVREIAKEADINEDLHLLLLGRPAVGKSTFAGELTEGKIKGSSGPSGGTKSSDIPGQWKYIKTEKMEKESSTKSSTKKAYFVHDTVGQGSIQVDLDEMKREAKEVCEQSRHCNVFLCIGWEDRIDDINTQIAFDVCDSLGMWQNVIVVITKCDSTYQESDSTSEESIQIKRIEHDWKDSIAVKLESMNVEGSEIAKITEKIVFYPNNKIKPADQESRLIWAKTLMKRLKDIIQNEKKADNAAPALSNGISIMLNLLSQTIERFNALGCIQPVPDDL